MIILVQKSLRVFGPPGIHSLLRTTLGYSSMRFSMPIIVAEWTIDPDGGHPPRPEPSLPGVAFAKVRPNLSSLANVQDSEQLVRRLSRQREQELEVRHSFCPTPLPS